MTIETDAGQSIDELAGLLGGTPADLDAEPEESNAGAEDQQHDDTGGDEHTDPEGEPEDDSDNGNADDATDPDAEETDPEAEDPPEAESDDSDPEPLYPVTLDGKEERVTLKEALAGYQRNADYTRKTQQVADERKAVQAAQAEASAQRDQYAQVLEVLQQRIGSPESERTEAQWAELRRTNEAAYATEWADFQRRQEARGKIRAEQERVAGEQQAERVQKLRAVVAEHATKFAEALPVLKTPKGKEYLGKLREYVLGQGFSEQEASQAYDHRILLLADKARQWDAHQAALKTAQNKLKGARQVEPPAARQPARRPQAAQRDAQMKKFSRSGRVEDAVDLI